MLLTSRKKKILPSKRQVTSRPLSEHKTWVYTRHTALRHRLIRLCLINKLILVKEARLPQYAHTFSSCTIGHCGWTGSKLALYFRRPLVQLSAQTQDTLKADSHIACCAHAVPLPCRAARGLECVFPIGFTQCGRVWFTLAMPCPCHALTMPFFSSPRHSTAVERRPVSYLPAFGFFRLPRGVPRRLLSEAYQSSSQRSIPTSVKSGSEEKFQMQSLC